MNSERHWGLLGRVLGLLTITAALASCRGSAESSVWAGKAVTTGVASASLSVSGSPAATVLAYTNYSFQPTAAAPTGTSLTFSIHNKPSWAWFGSLTGQLSGTPSASDARDYPDIIITASDGRAFAALPGFSIKVTSSPNPLPATWQGRLSGKPHIFAVDYIQPGQLATGQGAESVVARYPLVITGETYATPNPMTTYLNNVRSLNSNIVLISYLSPLQDSMPESTGPGYDAMRYLETIESAYLHDASGNRLYCTDAFGKRAYFDPASNDVRSAVLTAIQAVLTAYPFDGIFLDNYDVQNAMLLDSQGNQYLGTPGQVWDRADYASKLAAMTSLATMIRDAWPDALIVANGNNAFPSLNGEMVENHAQISRVPAQAAAIAGRALPFMPLFMDDPVSGPVDPLIATDMAQVQALGAWYGASVTYQFAIWPAAFGP